MMMEKNEQKKNFNTNWSNWSNKSIAFVIVIIKKKILELQMIFCNENWIKYNPNPYPCPKTKRGVIFFLIGINTSDIYDCLVGWRMVLSSLLVGFFSDEDEKTKWNEKIRDFTTEFFYTVKKKWYVQIST